MRQAFLEADTPVSLSGKVVYWLEVKHVRDPAILIGAIASCVSVASALRHAQQTSEAGFS